MQAEEKLAALMKNKGTPPYRAMIAAAGYYRFMAGQRDDYDIEAVSMWPLTSDAYEIL